MPGRPLAVARAAHPLTLVLGRLGAVDGGAGEACVAVAATELPALLVEAPEQTGLTLHRDPLAPLTGQVADAAQAGCTVARAHTAGHLRGCWAQRGKVIVTEGTRRGVSSRPGSHSPFVRLKAPVLPR